MEANFYKINESLENSFYQIPEELFRNPLYNEKLGIEAKVLYGFLLRLDNEEHPSFFHHYL